MRYAPFCALPAITLAWLAACGSFDIDDVPAAPGPDAGTDAAPVVPVTPTDDAATGYADADADADAEAQEASVADAHYDCSLLTGELALTTPGVLEAAHWTLNALVQKDTGLVAEGAGATIADIVARCIDPAPHTTEYGVRFEYDLTVDIAPSPGSSATLLVIGTSNAPESSLSLTLGPGGVLWWETVSSSAIVQGGIAGETTVVGAAYRKGETSSSCTFAGTREAAATRCVTVADLKGSAAGVPFEVNTIEFGLSGASNGARTTSRRLKVTALEP